MKITCEDCSRTIELTEEEWESATSRFFGLQQSDTVICGECDGTMSKDVERDEYEPEDNQRGCNIVIPNEEQEQPIKTNFEGKTKFD